MPFDLATDPLAFFSLTAHTLRKQTKQLKTARCSGVTNAYFCMLPQRGKRMHHEYFLNYGTDDKHNYKRREREIENRCKQ
jgi:hypothetical protein